jgi:4-hydroxymandelate oxidase
MTELVQGADLERIVSLAEFEPLARERMAPSGFDYVAGGAWDEITLGENVEAWRRFRFVPRVLMDIRHVDVSGGFLKRRTPLPFAIAPMAVQGLAHPEAELETFRGAAAAGIPFCLSTSSSRSLEDVASVAPDAERWFQLYLVDSLDYSRTLVERAAEAGYKAIVLTVDLPVLGFRERDRRSGFALPVMAHVDRAAAHRASRYAGLEEQHLVGLNWGTVAAIQTWSPLPLVLKGVLSPEDARLAAEAGVAGVVVSNHGARQLDRSLATAVALPAVVDAVGGRCEVWVDGGIRRGLDIAIALSLGATGVLLGRPMYWAVAAAGAAGVQRAIEIMREELTLTLQLLGCGATGDLKRELLA